MDMISSRDVIGAISTYVTRDPIDRIGESARRPVAPNQQPTSIVSPKEINRPSDHWMSHHFKFGEVDGKVIYFSSFNRWKRHFREYGVREEEFFFVRFGWFAAMNPGGLFTAGIGLLKGIRNPNVVFCANSKLEYDNILSRCPFIEEHLMLLNEAFQNCIVYHYPFRITGEPLRYPAVMSARQRPYKRRWLASGVEGIALIVPNFRAPEVDVPGYAYRNDRYLSYEESNRIFNQSRCGLILSALEGSNRTTTEYLLSGLPVVSTPEKGGRTAVLDDSNSLVVDVDFTHPRSEENRGRIASAVASFAAKEPDRKKIRAGLAGKVRSMFEEFAIRATDRVGGDRDHWMSAAKSHSEFFLEVERAPPSEPVDRSHEFAKKIRLGRAAPKVRPARNGGAERRPGPTRSSGWPD